MNEIIVNKVGGTSNATPEAVAMSMEWADDALVTVVSAPGKLSSKEAEDFPIPTHVGPEIIGQKVTDILKLGYERHRSEGVFPAHYAGAVAGRYQHIVEGIGSPLNCAWLDNIHTRIQAASDTGWSQTRLRKRERGRQSADDI